MDSDYIFARHLQKEFDLEYQTENPPIDLTYDKKRKRSLEQQPVCLIDPSWELIDPTPDIHVLFVTYNERFFWNQLFTVTVSWSKRMTRCAGICSYHGHGNCYITLSEPLLKLRPRKDLVETLLHEMIHAFLFVTNNDRDRDGHGPEFHKHMYRINREAGTNVTVYHTFHDEVRSYQKHVWRCDGPCQNMGPYYGILRRANNRAPGPSDRWWSEHQRKCGGRYIKIESPPENASQLKKPKVLGDITKYITKTPPTSIPKNMRTTNTAPVSGRPVNQLIATNTTPTNPDYSVVRNHWLNKFNQTSAIQIGTNQIATNKSATNQTTEYSENNNYDKLICPNCKIAVAYEDIAEHVLACESTAKLSECPVCGIVTKEEYIGEHVDECLKSSSRHQHFLLNAGTKVCEFCKMPVPENIFIEHVDKCTKKFSNRPQGRDTIEPTHDTVLCLVCNSKILKSEINNHTKYCVAQIFDDDL